MIVWSWAVVCALAATQIQTLAYPTGHDASTPRQWKLKAFRAARVAITRLSESALHQRFIRKLLNLIVSWIQLLLSTVMRRIQKGPH
jgi:hypothetical protein